jgi:hypothetical protein
MTFKPIEIFDVVDHAYQTEIYKYVTDIKFPWHYIDDATFEISNDPQTSTPSFVNLIYHNNNETNPHLDFFKPLLEAMLEKTGYTLSTLLRIRAGFLLNTKYVFPSMPYKYNSPHRDFEQEHFTAVYYVNKSDGDTVIFKEIESAEKYNVLHRSTPEQGKLVMFNGWHYHSSTCPKMFTKRIAITINFTAVKNG